MMHRNGKKTPFRAAQLGIFAKNSENTSRNTSWLNCYNSRDSAEIFYGKEKENAV